MDSGCFPFLCLTGPKPEWTTLLSTPADVRQMLSSGVTSFHVLGITRASTRCTGAFSLNGSSFNTSCLNLLSSAEPTFGTWGPWIT